MESASLIRPLSASEIDEPKLSWHFEVEGAAVPQGSWVAFASKTTGFAMAKPSNEKALNAWRDHVAGTARRALPSWLDQPLDAPCFVSLIFVRARNDSDYLADGVSLRKGAPVFPATAPDIDKLTRAMLDALTGVAFVNDSRVVSCMAIKRFAERHPALTLGELPTEDRERVVVEVTPL